MRTLLVLAFLALSTSAFAEHISCSGFLNNVPAAINELGLELARSGELFEDIESSFDDIEKCQQVSRIRSVVSGYETKVSVLKYQIDTALGHCYEEGNVNYLNQQYQTQRELKAWVRSVKNKLMPYVRACGDFN